MNQVNYIVLSLYNRRPPQSTRTMDWDDIRVKKCIRSLRTYEAPFKFLHHNSEHPIRRLYEWLSVYRVYYEYVIIADFRKFMWTKSIDTILTSQVEDVALVRSTENSKKLDFMIVRSELLWSYLNNAERMMTAFLPKLDNYDVLDRLPAVVLHEASFIEFVPDDMRPDRYYHCHNRLTYNFPFCAMAKFDSMSFKPAVIYACIVLIALVIFLKFFGTHGARVY